MVPPDLPVHVEPMESAEWAASVDDQEVWVFQDWEATVVSQDQLEVEELPEMMYVHFGSLEKNVVKNVDCFINFQNFLLEKDQNIHLNDKFPFKIANIFLQK